MKKLLIIYYSWSNGNTERIAKMLQSETDSDILKIDTVVPNSGIYDDVANVVCDMQIQFDSTGGSNLETPQEQINEWIQSVKNLL